MFYMKSLNFDALRCILSLCQIIYWSILLFPKYDYSALESGVSTYFSTGAKPIGPVAQQFLVAVVFVVNEDQI